MALLQNHSLGSEDIRAVATGYGDTHTYVHASLRMLIVLFLLQDISKHQYTGTSPRGPASGFTNLV